MGLRHVIVVDGNLFVVGIVTRFDMNEHRLHHYWEEAVRFYYLGYIIFETLYDHLTPKVYIVQMDMSEHSTLTSAKCHIDFLTQ